MKASEVMLRIELEKARESFNKERKLLNLKINELEEEASHQVSTSDSLNLASKLKRLEEDNFRLNQLYQAGLHKIDYYASLINSKKVRSECRISLYNSLRPTVTIRKISDHIYNILTCKIGNHKYKYDVN